MGFRGSYRPTRWFFWRSIPNDRLHIPIGSMYIWYVDLHLVDFYGFHVGKYTIVPSILWVLTNPPHRNMEPPRWFFYKARPFFLSKKPSAPTRWFAQQTSEIYGCFLKWWFSPTTMGFFLLKMISTWGVTWGYHHLRKHPYMINITPPKFGESKTNQ